MDVRDTLSTQLPPPRDDEPASLRQDILDELADHLTCAYNRELLRGVDSSVARQRVLERFGDPAAVARRLWLDAMRGKIMAQRVLIATCLVVMLACAASVGLAWHWMNQDRLLRGRAAAEAIEANRRVSEALSHSQAMNQEMLKQMREMTRAVTHPVSPDWNPVTFKLTEETADGPPAAGFSVTLTRVDGNTARMGRDEMRSLRDDPLTLSSSNGSRRQLRLVLPPGIIGQGAAGQFGGMGGTGMAVAAAKSIHRTSDASGVVDFGAVQPGDYKFQITKNWATGQFSTAGELNVGPGSKVQKSIVCPKTPPDRATVRVRCSWPVDLEAEQLVLYAPFAFRYRKLDPGQEWALSDTSSFRRPRRGSNWGMIMSQAQGFPASRSVFCGPGTMLAEILERKGLFFWTFSRVNADGEAIEVTGPDVSADILVEHFRDVKLPVDTPEPRELAWEQGTYGLDRLIVLRPTRSQDVEAGRRRFDVLVGSFYNFGPTIQLRGEQPTVYSTIGDGVQYRRGPPSKKDLETSNSDSLGQVVGGMENNSEWRAWQKLAPTLELPPEFWDKVDIGFEARLGQVNEWTIPLPDELIKAVRTALKVGPAKKAKPADPAAPADRK
jgi:hypothetical protein